MTLGKKLALLRKQASMTQQQLGERLNLSAQAVSKWENDLAEPDLTTLRALANIYKVSIDEILNVDIDNSGAKSTVDAEQVAAAVKETLDEQKKAEPQTLGFCKRCGVAINEDNLGAKEPFMKCKKCLAIERVEAVKRKEEEVRKKEAEIRAKKAEAADKAARFAKRQDAIRWQRTKSFIWAGIGAALFLAISLIVPFSVYDFPPLVITLIGTCVVFMFISMLFFDTPVTSVVSYMCSASIKWPGLIFTFDFDGFAWLIKMKILFAVLGFIFGTICSILGIILGLIISPFVFPYIMVKFHRDIRDGVVGDYIEDAYEIEAQTK